MVAVTSSGAGPVPGSTASSGVGMSGSSTSMSTVAEAFSSFTAVTVMVYGSAEPSSYTWV